MPLLRFLKPTGVPSWLAQATVTLDHFALLGLPSVGSAQTAPVSLQCTNGNTIWSQATQSYTQLVDLADIDKSSAMLPPGNAEARASEAAQDQTSLWASGSLRPAPLSQEAIDAITVSTQVVSPRF
ncbi:MAG: penicillin acylase family protein [Kofleriaceae bacterium]|nr:penicillin acylase family protein [Kofleriaceae bacterium]